MAVRKTKTRSQPGPLERAPLLEWVTAICGLAAAVGAIGYLTWEGLQPGLGRPPVLIARAEGVAVGPAGYTVSVVIANQSRVTASAVQLEGAVGEEASTLTFDYVPGKGRREGSMTFRADPRREGLVLSVKGQVTP